MLVITAIFFVLLFCSQLGSAIIWLNISSVKMRIIGIIIMVLPVPVTFAMNVLWQRIRYRFPK
jgi:uncharacterized membrane protein